MSHGNQKLSPIQRRGHALDILSGVVSLALVCGFTWWFLELVADAGAVI